MSDRIVTAFSAAQLPELQENTQAPKSIVYLPEGKHDITPKVNGKAERITINVPADQGEEIAATLQAQHAEREKSSVRPWMDFEHKEGKASALTKGFRYEQGKGIMLDLEWTGAGAEAVEAKDYSYFSPTFLVNADNVPSGLPERGPLGALVNEPAFRKMEKIAAADAAKTQTNNTPIMSKLILAALAITATGDEAEAEAVKTIEAMNGKISEQEKTIEAKDGEIKDLTEKVKAHNTERATALVEAAVTDGRIAPKDEETKADFIAKIEAGDEFAEKILSKLPRQEDLSKPLVKAGDTAKASKADRRIEAQAQAKKQLGESAQFSTVWARAQEIDPEAFTD